MNTIFLDKRISPSMYGIIQVSKKWIKYTYVLSTSKMVVLRVKRPNDSSKLKKKIKTLKYNYLKENYKWCRILSLKVVFFYFIYLKRKKKKDINIIINVQITIILQIYDRQL